MKRYIKKIGSICLALILLAPAPYASVWARGGVVAGMAVAAGMAAGAILEGVTAGVVGAEDIMVEATGAAIGEATIVAGVMRPMAWAWD